MKNQLSTICLLCSLGLSIKALAIHPMISASPISPHIDQPVVVAIYRDSSSLLWIGTQEGLYRFDGTNVTAFNSDDRNTNWIPASDIRAISETEHHDILVATHGGGLIQWDTQLSQFRNVPSLDSSEFSQLTDLIVLKNGNYVLSTKDALFIYDVTLNSVDSWLNSNEVAPIIGRPFVIAEGGDNNLVIGSSTGLTYISLKDKTAVPFKLPILNDGNSFGVTAVEYINDNEIVIGTNTGHLAVLQIISGQVLSLQKIGGKASVYISDLALVDGELVIATDHGLYYSDKNLLTIEDISREGAGLSNNDIYVLYTDKQYTYIGTYNGLDVLSFSPFRIFNSDNSALYDDILAFNEDRKGRIWIGTYDGLYIFDKSTNKHSKIDSQDSYLKTADHRITAIEARDDDLWLGFYQGGVQSVNMQSETSNLINIDDAKEIYVTDILADKNGRDLWIATYSHGLIRVKPENIDYFYASKQIHNRRILSLFQLSTGDMLISTNDTLYLFDAQKEQFSIVNLTIENRHVSPLVLSINEDDYGNVWLGTKDKGLYRWDRQEKRGEYLISQIGNVSDFMFSTIYGIEIDDQSNLWCSTQNGIVKLDSDGNLVKRFTTADGLQGNDFNLGASFTSRDGLMYFGGVNGYNRFDPNEVEIDTAISPMRLTGITLPSRQYGNLYDMAGIDTLELAHEDRFVTFEFSVLDFLHPEQHQYRYMLNEFDSDWVDSGSRNTATYTNLPSGNYLLRVQGANSAGIWNEKGITLRVHVSPPPWLTWWAFCLYFILSLFIFWCGLRIYRSYVLDRQSRILAMEMFEAENSADDEIQEHIELQDELVQSAYAHILATLTLVRNIISHQARYNSDNDLLAMGSIKRVSALSYLENCLYYYEGGPVVNLKRYADILINEMLKSCPVDPESIITVNEISPRLVPAELASPISIILFELLENCMLHAFDGSSPANYIRLVLGLEDAAPGISDSLRLTVSDNGAGFSEDPEKLLSGSTGLGIVQSLATDLGGTLAFSLKNGTVVTLTLPIPASLDY